MWIATGKRSITNLSIGLIFFLFQQLDILQDAIIELRESVRFKKVLKVSYKIIHVCIVKIWIANIKTADCPGNR